MLAIALLFVSGATFMAVTPGVAEGKTVDPTLGAPEGDPIVGPVAMRLGFG